MSGDGLDRLSAADLSVRGGTGAAMSRKRHRRLKGRSKPGPHAILKLTSLAWDRLSGFGLECEEVRGYHGAR